MSEAANGSAIQAGTAEGLMQFLDYVVAKGYGPATAVDPQKSAVRKILATVEGDRDYGGVDVRALDLDDYLGRFETKARGQNLKVESIQAYRGRMTRAVQTYLDFLETGRPPSYRGVRRSDRTKAEPGSNGKAAPAAAAPSQDSSPQQQPGGERLHDFSFPLRSGTIANLRLPVKLEKADAERLAAFIRTLVAEPQLELGQGKPEDQDIPF
jgi:hypothetical protein